MSDKKSSTKEVEASVKKREELTRKVARERRDDLIRWGFNEEDPALVEAIPAVGKSYGVVKWVSETGNPITVFTERHDLYNQYEDWATDDFDLKVQQLPVFHDSCPTVEEEEEDDFEETGYSISEIQKNQNSENWSDRILDKYEQGVSGRELHNRATTYFDEELPCQADGPCPYMEALNRDYADVDVLVGNFRQVYAEQYRTDRYLVFDEFPNESFIQEFSSSVVSNTVSHYLSNESSLPFENWVEAVNYNPETEGNQDVDEWLDNRKHDRNTRPLYRGASSQIDARGPLLTEIAIRFAMLDNSWRRADLSMGRVAVQSPNSGQLSLLDPPLIDDSKGVIALDGTPCVEKWELLLGDDLTHRSVFDPEQKREFLRDVLEIQLIQTATTTRPYHSGNNVTPHDDLALISSITEREQQKPSIISSLRAIEQYENIGLDPLIDKTEYYNNLKGSGRLGGERLGVVIGCPQPSDDYIQMWGALAGHAIIRKKYENGNMTKGVDLDFGSFGNAILYDSRENEVLQAAMRFGRKETNGERGATVYVHTVTLPEWVQPEKQIPNIHAFEKNHGVSKVVKGIKSQDNWRTTEWKTGDIADDVKELTRRQVLNVLRDNLSDEGYVNFRRGGRGNGYIWSNNCLEDAGSHGIVEW